MTHLQETLQENQGKPDLKFMTTVKINNKISKEYFSFPKSTLQTFFTQNRERKIFIFLKTFWGHLKHPGLLQLLGIPFPEKEGEFCSFLLFRGHSFSSPNSSVSWQTEAEDNEYLSVLIFLICVCIFHRSHQLQKENWTGCKRPFAFFFYCLVKQVIFHFSDMRNSLIKPAQIIYWVFTGCILHPLQPLALSRETHFAQVHNSLTQS